VMSKDSVTTTPNSTHDEPKPTSQSKSSKNLKTTLSGGIAGMISKTCTAPLERVQILNQTGAAHETILSTLRHIIKKDGAIGLWRGNFANCVRIFPHKSILFGVNDWLVRQIPSSSVYVNFLTGATAGAIATTVTYPIDLIRARLSGTWDPNSRSMIKITQQIFAKEGTYGFYKGLSITLFGAFPYEGVRIGVYSAVKDFMPIIESDKGNHLHPLSKLCAGALAGAAAGVVTYPTDTIRRMLQVQGTDGLPKFKGVVDCLIYAYHRGLVRFYHGLSAKLVRVMPDAAILFLTYEYLKNYFQEE